MKNAKECKCGKEDKGCLAALQKENVIQAVGEEPICITGHPGFAAVCLNAWGIHLSAGLFKTRQERKYQKTGSEERYYKIKVNRKHD